MVRAHVGPQKKLYRNVRLFLFETSHKNSITLTNTDIIGIFVKAWQDFSTAQQHETSTNHHIIITCITFRTKQNR